MGRKTIGFIERERSKIIEEEKKPTKQMRGRGEWRRVTAYLAWWLLLDLYQVIDWSFKCGRTSTKLGEFFSHLEHFNLIKLCEDWLSRALDLSRCLSARVTAVSACATFGRMSI